MDDCIIRPGGLCIHVSCFYRSRVTVDVGKFVKLAVNHELVQLIGGEGASNCEPGFDNYDKCMYDNLCNITIAELDCTVPWLPGDRCEVYIEHNEQAISFFLFLLQPLATCL